MTHYDDGIHGSFLDWMEWAVSNSQVIIILLCRKYNQSDNCKSEACRAKQLKKKIVPIVVEPGFTGEGWLAMIIAGLLYYDGSSKNALEQSMRWIVECELHDLRQ